MNIFVTGATGFAGSHLVEQLLAAGQTVYGLIRPQEQGQPWPFIPVVGDVLDVASLTTAVAHAQPDLIYHLAGLANVGLSWREPALTMALNAGGTANLLEAAVAYGRPRIVAVTSGELYGPLPIEAMPINGHSQPNPIHPYAISKVAASHLLQVYHQRYGLEVIEARPFNHIGPRQALGFVLPDFASQVASILRGQHEPRLRVGNLDAQRDFTDVRDVVRAYQLLGELGQPGQMYLISSGRPVAISQILNLLLELAATAVEIIPDPARMRPSDTPILYASHDKIQHHTGWTPTIPLRQSVQEVLAEWLAK